MRLVYLVPVLSVLTLTGCDSLTDAVTADGLDLHAAATVDVSGDWLYEVEVFLVFPGFVAPEFGYESESPVLQFRCTGSGTAQFDQDGTSFILVSNQIEASCETPGGQVGPAPWPPGPATSFGTLNGRSLHYASQPDAAGITCGGNGVVKEVVAGTATEIHLRGGCDLSAFPFRPAQAKNAYVLTRP
jgi:hypothetical protein